MSVPDRPDQVDQLDGSRYAGLNCTCAAGAMALDRATLGVHRTTGAKVRALTGDTTGGTTLSQVASALKRGWDVELDVHLDVPFVTLEQRLHRGQGAIIQGWEGVFKGTRFQSSETFAGNHATFVNEGRDWRQRADGLWIAGSFLVFNPLADGRRPGIAQSPYWVPRDTLVRWCGKLDVSSAAQNYIPLGIGMVYAAFTPDTEPHVHLKHGAHRTTPFPDHVVARHPRGTRVWVRGGPGPEYPVIDRVRSGTPFLAYQVVEGGAGAGGEHTWYGDHNGGRWIVASRLTGKGGTS